MPSKRQKELDIYTVVEDIQVVVIPLEPWPPHSDKAKTAKETIATAHDIKNSIERHVDNIGQVKVEYRTVQRCRYCNSEWEEDDDGSPMCCNNAVDAWETDQSKEAPHE